MTRYPSARTGPARRWALLLLSIALVLSGGALGAAVQTSWGAVAVRDITLPGDGGEQIAAKLYVPDGASADAPAPGILAIHGANNSSEMQSAYAIELSRRGYVVLTPDMYGHGNSDGSEASGPISPAALRYLHGLPMVDGENVGLGGHSRGGAESYHAAAMEPELYRSIVFEASGPVPQVLPEPDDPPVLKNALFIMATLEEFTAPVWGEAVPGQVPHGDAASAAVGVDDVEPGKTYGDPEDGSARKMVMVAGNHPLMTFSFDAVQQAIDWYDRTLEGGRRVDGQVWILKEIGGGIALLGGVLAVFAVGGLLWSASGLGAVRQPEPEAVGPRAGWPWLLAAALTGIVPAVTFWPFQELGVTRIGPSTLWPQNWANGIATWAVLNGAISAALIAIWFVRARRTRGVGMRDLGLTGSHGSTGRIVAVSAGVAVLAFGAAYVLLSLSEWLFQIDFRFYTLAFAMIDARHWALFLAYLLPFAAFLLVLNVGLNSQLRWTGGREASSGRTMAVFSVVLAGPLLLLFLVDYAPIFFGGAMLMGDPLKSQFVIIGYQFLALLPLAACLAVFFFRLTGTVYTGAFIGALMIVWNIVSTTTVHVDDGGAWGTGAVLARIVLPLVAAFAFGFAAFRMRRTAEVAAD